MNKKRKAPITNARDNQLVLYTDKRGDIELRADIEKDTIWATLDQISEVFGRDKSVISRHLKNIFASHELDRKATVAKNATVQSEGGRRVTRAVEYYNLDVILSVGYRVNSKQATKFRIWSTRVLRQYLVGGFNLDRNKLAVSTDKLGEVKRAISFIESGVNGGPLKAKLKLNLSKDLMK
ncbi:MAG: virulence RhuM family protein [Patescibacteria group bacterium]|nr:virulence RhuM family protein [Patescibacteria group bacterium]